MFERPLVSFRCLLSGVLLLAVGWMPARAASSIFPGPIQGDDEVSNDRRNILDEHPLTARPPANNVLPKLIFYPPNPPPLGVPVNLREDRDITTGAPDALASFVTEPFYAPLSTFISPVVTAYQGGETLSDEERRRLAHWRQQRDTLLAELRETIQRLAYASPGTRLREFIALAEKQTAALVTLEREAEQMRERLARKAPWDEYREWRLSGEPAAGPGPGMILELQVMRAAAFYFDGLSPAQRRLLREIAMELEGTTFVPRDSRPTAQLYIYFQPETARIPRPAPQLPPTAARLLRKFIDDKARLKEELRAEVFAADAGRSRRSLADLADIQAPRIQELEQTAEDLRAALARVPEFTRAPRPAPLSPVLTKQIDAYLRAKRELVGLHGRDDDAGLAPLQEDLDALRAAIALVPEATLEEGQAPDAFLTNFLKRRREAAAYHEYDIATLEPGLSPEQRRLLFGGAVAMLQLPLPGAEEQPTLPPGTLLR